MIKKEKTIISEQLELFEIDFEKNIKKAKYEIEVSEGFDRVIVVANSEGREINVDVDGIQESNVSECPQVKVFFGKIIRGTKKLIVKISTKGAEKIQLSIALIKKTFKNTVKQLPCKACKTLIKISVTAILGHFGVPFFEPMKTINMPGVDIPPEFPGGASIPAEDIPVLVGKPIQLGEDIKHWFENAVDNCEGFLVEFFNDIDKEILTGIRFAFEAFNWVFESVDKIYTRVCEILKCCNTCTAVN